MAETKGNNGCGAESGPDEAEAEAAGEDPNLIVVNSNLMLLQLSNSNWVKRLTAGIANGNTVIIENCPVDLDATLDPVLQRAMKGVDVPAACRRRNRIR